MDLAQLNIDSIKEVFMRGYYKALDTTLRKVNGWLKCAVPDIIAALDMVQ